MIYRTVPRFDSCSIRRHADEWMAFNKLTDMLISICEYVGVGGMLRQRYLEVLRQELVLAVFVHALRKRDGRLLPRHTAPIRLRKNSCHK